MKKMVVDDEAMLVKGTRYNLQSDGFQVVSGGTGLDAVRLMIVTSWQSAISKQVMARQVQASANSASVSAAASWISSTRRLTVPQDSWLLDDYIPAEAAKK